MGDLGTEINDLGLGEASREQSLLIVTGCRLEFSSSLFIRTFRVLAFFLPEQLEANGLES